jgi:Cupredoxin-like domain
MLISKSQTLLAILGATIILGGIATRALAGDSAEIRFENHQFKPLTLIVPTGQPLTIKVINASNETIEFESFKLNREKAISPGESTLVHLPALSAGNYDFYDDFHQDVPQGNIVAK